ncbi:hypothetical protein P0D72_36960 [Paraburkholderia sediminicola]|uniref:hypothetical protein n=1 Tax=Paraburkholderia sediminicola TaxID=458836 RepID=UPI0038BCE51A
MLRFADDLKVYLYREPIDFRCGIKRVNQTVGGQFTPLGAHSASLQLQKSC